MSTTIEKPVGAPYDQDETSSFDMNYTQAAPRRANEIGAARLFSYRVVDGQRVEYFADRPTVNRNTFPIEGHVDVRNWNTRNTEHELVGIATVIDSQGEYADAYENERAEH